MNSPESYTHPLMQDFDATAARRNREALLAAGAPYVYTAADEQLLMAYENRDVHKFVAALQAGASPDAEPLDGWGDTLASQAVREGQAEFAEVLLDAGANPLLNEAEMVFELCMHGPAPLLQRVIEQHQVPLGIQGGGDYMSMVDYAAAEGQIDCLKVLHAAGADMLAHNGRALCMACLHRQPEAVRYLVHECNAPLEQEHDDRSPLLYAVQADAPECARILLDAGANPHHPDMEGTALLQWAKSDAMRQLLATYCPR